MKYTEEEIEILRSKHLELSYRDLGKILRDRSEANIREKARSLRLPLKSRIKQKRALTSYNAYGSWSGMITRCENKNREFWSNYGGRGIKVCDIWRNSFVQFLKDMGERTKTQSIDRIDPNGNYEPGNCRWIEKSEQIKTTRRFLSIKQCIDCESNRGNRNGRCHKCSEYFRRHGIARPKVDNVNKWRQRPLNCPSCEIVCTQRVKGVCVKCYQKQYKRNQRSPA